VTRPTVASRPATQPVSGGEAARAVPAALEARGLAKAVGGRRVVDRVDFAVAPGEVFGLVGPEGAGKTTTIRMVLGLSRPDEGEVYVLGRPVRAGAHVLRRVGAVVDPPGFYPWLSGSRNVEVLLAGRVGRRDVDAALEAVGLRGVAGAKVKTYTQGMRRRLSLAVALCTRPDVLVLDEPAKGLDAGGVRDLRELIRDAAGSGCAVFLSSHAVEEIERACDRVAVLSRGRVVAQGTVAELDGVDVWLSVVVATERHRHAIDALSPLPVRADGAGGILVRAPSGEEVSRRLATAGIFPEALTRKSATLEERVLGLLDVPERP
jgi:ABC-2 type transport system ATP-binding protein